MWEIVIHQEEVKVDAEPKALEEWLNYQLEQFTENYPAAHKWMETDALLGTKMMTWWLFTLNNPNRSRGVSTYGCISFDLEMWSLADSSLWEKTCWQIP